jgi:hypothetical protein
MNDSGKSVDSGTPGDRSARTGGPDDIVLRVQHQLADLAAYDVLRALLAELVGAPVTDR